MLLTRYSLSPLEALVQSLGIIKPVVRQLVVLDQVRDAAMVTSLPTSAIEGKQSNMQTLINI